MLVSPIIIQVSWVCTDGDTDSGQKATIKIEKQSMNANKGDCIGNGAEGLGERRLGAALHLTCAAAILTARAISEPFWGFSSHHAWRVELR